MGETQEAMCNGAEKYYSMRGFSCLKKTQIYLFICQLQTQTSGVHRTIIVLYCCVCFSVVVNVLGRSSRRSCSSQSYTIIITYSNLAFSLDI